MSKDNKTEIKYLASWKFFTKCSYILKIAFLFNPSAAEKASKSFYFIITHKLHAGDKDKIENHWINTNRRKKKKTSNIFYKMHPAGNICVTLVN